MNYCTVNQWVENTDTGYVGQVVKVISRRTLTHSGMALVQFGAGGPFVKLPLDQLEEASEKQYRQKVGLE